MAREAGPYSDPKFDTVRVDGQAATNSVEHISNRAIDAKKRIVQAQEALGPGLNYILIAVCGRNESIGSVERKMGWGRGAGKSIFKLALGRLSDLYGCKPGHRAKRHSQDANA